MSKIPFYKFPSIENFASMHHSLKKRVFAADRPLVEYKSKMKLHGTNAAVTIEGDLVVGQKRTASLNYPHDDNAGFAAWLEPIKGLFLDKKAEVCGQGDFITIYGEWAGPGVQKGDAVSLISRKMFFVFAAKVNGVWEYEPEELRKMTPHHDDIAILPWMKYYMVDLSRETSIEEFLKEVNDDVAEAAKEDAYIAYKFEISAPGEGFVFYPVNIARRPVTSEYEIEGLNVLDEEYIFKAKTETHGAKKIKAATIDPQLHDDAAKFAVEFVTDARMKQAVSELGLDMDNLVPKDTGSVLKWVSLDVLKESKATLEASGMEWKQVAKAVSSLASVKFMRMIERR